MTIKYFQQKTKNEKKFAIFINDTEFDEYYIIFISYKILKNNAIDHVNFQVVDREYYSVLKLLNFEKFEEFQVMFDSNIKNIIKNSIIWLKNKNIKKGNFLEKVIKKYKII